MFNDETWYRVVRLAQGTGRNKDAMTHYLLETLPRETPDGAPLTFTTVRAALKG